MVHLVHIYMKNSLKNFYTEKRPWGFFNRYTYNEPSTIKIIHVKAGASLSLQYHHDRAEFWHIISGTGFVVVGKKKYVAKPGKEFTVPPKTLHRIIAETPLQILEIATGHFEESDIVRVQDSYGRTKKASSKKA
jgi:mannose-6-phosphate isomerase-like protein (cupin superfamily)